MRAINLVGILLAFGARVAVAQATQASHGCADAVRLVTSRAPASGDEWVVHVLPRCGRDGARAIARALANNRHSRDRVALNILSAPARELRDAAIFTQAAEMALDVSASEEARVFAIRSLIYQLQPGGVLAYEELSTTRSDGIPQSCAGARSPHLTVVSGEPLPQDAKQRAAQIAAQLLKDESAPRNVRSAAVCLRGAA